MERFSQQVNKIKTDVHLEPDRKAAIRAQLVEFIDRTPVKEKASLFSFLNPLRVVLALALLVLLLGGTSFAAERSLPGEFLYPVKVRVNEEVRAAFSFGTEAKAEWANTRAERRLEEAETLASEGKLDAEQSNRLEGGFEHHAREVRNGIVDLQVSGNASASAKAASRLDAALDREVKLKLRVPTLEIENADSESEDHDNRDNSEASGKKQGKEKENGNSANGSVNVQL